MDYQILSKFFELPPEIFCQILLNLNLKDILHFGLTCHQTFEYWQNDQLWKAKYQHDFHNFRSENNKIYKLSPKTTIISLPGNGIIPKNNRPDAKENGSDILIWKEKYRQKIRNKIFNSPISAGFHHYGIIDDLGKLYMAGKNKFMNFGDGDMRNPIHIPFKCRVISISCSDDYTGAVTEDGKVYLWGDKDKITMMNRHELDGIDTNKPILIKYYRKRKAVKIVCDESMYGIIFEDGSLYYRYRIDNYPTHQTFIKLEEKITDITFTSHFHILTEKGNVYTLIKHYEFSEMIPSIKRINFKEGIKQISPYMGNISILTTNGETYIYDEHETDDQVTSEIILQDSPTKIKLPGNISFSITNAREIYDNTQALLTDMGRLYMMGINYHGMIADIETTDSLKIMDIDNKFGQNPRLEIVHPIEIFLGSRIEHITLGRNFTIAITEKNEIHYWGELDFAQDNPHNSDLSRFDTSNSDGWSDNDHCCQDWADDESI